jgi:hypothetical protein
VCLKNSLATPTKLVALARQCKNDKYADCMLAAQKDHVSFSTRIKTVKHAFSKLIGKRLAKKLAASAPRAVNGGCKVGRSKVRTNTIEPLFAYHHIKKWRLKAVANLDDDPVAIKLLGAVILLETITSQTL